MPAPPAIARGAAASHPARATQCRGSFRYTTQDVARCTLPQQCAYLGIPREITRSFSNRLLELCGYSLYKGIMGHIDGESPAVVLGDGRLAERAYSSARSQGLTPEAYPKSQDA